MAAVRDSLFVHGNMPCPSPTYSLPPGRSPDHASSRPVKYNASKAPPMNTEEELRNILRQAKQPVISGPTQVAKRSEYFRKIKHLNDGMYRQQTGGDGASLELDVQPHVDDFVLEGRKLDDVKHGELRPDGVQQAVDTEREVVDLDGQETIHSAAGSMPARGLRHSSHSKSAKSFKSFYSNNSDPPLRPAPPAPPRSIALPQLTIGAGGRHRSHAQQHGIRGEPALSIVLRNAMGSKDSLEEAPSDDFAIAEYRFPCTSPRRIVKAGERTPRVDSSNYGNITLSDLNECLHIQQPQVAVAPRAEHEEYVLQDYLTQFKQAQEHAKQLSRVRRSSSSVNPYKLLKNPHKPRPAGGQQQHSPRRYEFKTVDSYLKFNKLASSRARAADARSAAALGSSVHTPSAHAYSDALLLKMMSDLNAPAAHARQSASMAAVRLVNGGAVVDPDLNPDLNPAASAPPPPHVVPCNSPVNTRKPAGKPASPQRDREHIQHIVYVPSGQTAKVRLIKG